MAHQEALSSTEGKKTRFFYGYIVVAAAFLIMVVMWGTYYTFGVFFKPLLAEFGWTRAMLSAAFSLCTLLGGLLSIGTGRLTDRFGPRLVLSGCGFFLGLGLLLMSQVNTIWQLYLFYGVIVAIGMSGAIVPMLSIVARWFIKKRGLMSGIAISGIGAGTMIMPPLASWLISNYDWRTSYIVVGIIALVLIILAAQFLKRDPGQIGQLPYGESGVKEDSLNLEAGSFSLRQVTQTRQFWLLCTMVLSFGTSLQIVMVHIVSHATDLEISAASAASILAVIGAVGVGGRVIMGGVGDRIGNRKTLVVSFSLVSIALFWLMAARELWMFYLFAAIFGLGYGGVAAMASPVIAELFGVSSLGIILGFVNFSVTIGEAIGPVMAGYIFDIIGSYNLAFLIGAVGSIVSLILASLLRPASLEIYR